MFLNLKRKIILLSSTLSLLFLFLFIFVINILNYKIIVDDADKIIELLRNNYNLDGKGPPNNHIPPTHDYKIEYDYFCIRLNNNNEIISFNTSKNFEIPEDTINNCIDFVISTSKEQGFHSFYRFNIIKKLDYTDLYFVNCQKKLESVSTFAFISILISIISFALILIIIFIIANKIIKPLELNYAKQKTFITDASHELKTPLTIINTNVDILEMEYGDNESFVDIHNQINRLKELTNNLVLLTKTEENNQDINFIDFPLSDVVVDTINQFKNTALNQNVKMFTDITPLLNLYGNEKEIRQLIIILLDNAIKYSKPYSNIMIYLEKQNHVITFTITNESKFKLDKDKMKFIFDRFYRLDSSRNSSTGGHGIGLSIAKAIVNKHNGKINAIVKNNNVFQISVSFNVLNKLF